MFVSDDGITFGLLAVLSVTGCWYCFSSSCKDRLKSNITPIRMPIPGSFKNLKLCVKTISEDCRPSYLSKSYLLTFLGYKLGGFSSISNQFPRLVLSRFQNIKCPSFAANDNFCLSSKLISVQLHTCHSFTTNDWQGYKSLVYRRCVWRHVWFGQNLWSCDKPSALVKCSWWKKICLNKQLCRQRGKVLIIILN